MTHLVILIGGASRRMGRDKAFLRRDGRRVLDHLHDAAAGLGMPVWLSGRAGAGIGRPQWPDIPDELHGQGPLSALAACLRRIRDDVLLVACDLTYADAALLAWLGNEADAHPDAAAIWPVADRGPEPCCAAYRQVLLPVASALVARGERSLMALAQVAPVVQVPCPAPLALGLRNCNQTADLDPRLDWEPPA